MSNQTELVNLLVLGASGDLTSRLLLPGLGTLLEAEPHRQVRILGAAVDPLADDEWKARVTTALTGGGCPSERAAQVIEKTSYRQVDLLDEEVVRQLIADLGETPSVVYFALPPAITEKVCQVLERTGIPGNVRLALEKPFGSDLESARRLNEQLYRFASEEQIYRVDHFLGRSGVLNILGFRFANRVFEPVWRAGHVESVEIIFDEALALEGRARYYDHAGALVDMIQSHLLLVLTMVAMEDMAHLDALELRDLMTHVLRSVELWDDDPVNSSLRARYTSGQTNGKWVPDYVAEEGVDPSRETETLAEVTVRVNNERWAGVPFRLRSGKAMGRDDRRIVINFKPVGHVPVGFGAPAHPNRLTIALSPERLILDIATNGAGDKFELEESSLVSHLGESAVRPYGEILAHIMDGDQLLSVRGDTAEELWRVLTPVVEAWRRGDVPMEEYAAGTAGPVTSRY